MQLDRTFQRFCSKCISLQHTTNTATTTTFGFLQPVYFSGDQNCQCEIFVGQIPFPDTQPTPSKHRLSDVSSHIKFSFLSPLFQLCCVYATYKRCLIFILPCADNVLKWACCVSFLCMHLFVWYFLCKILQNAWDTDLHFSTGVDPQIKIIATSGFLAAAKCINFVFDRGSAPNPSGGAYDAPPGPLVGWMGGEGEGRRVREVEGWWSRGIGRGKEKGGEGKGKGIVYFWGIDAPDNNGYKLYS